MRRNTTALVAACVAALAPTSAAQAVTAEDATPGDPAAKRFIRSITVDRMTVHQRALQQIADANGGTRAALTPGYDASVRYVTRVLTNAGYKVKLDRFDFPFWREAQPAVLAQVAPTPKTYRYGTAEDAGSADVDFITMAYSPTTSLTNARVVPTNDILVGGPGDVPSPGGSTSGCEPADYPAEVRGNVALVQRGTCAFVDKWALAEAAGATGVVIFNEGDTPDRRNPLYVDDAIDARIPAVISSFGVGKELYDAYVAGQAPTVDFRTFGSLTSRFLPQVIAETKGGDGDHVVVVGAHLDSVPEGPGVNDDGSGSAMLLTMAKRVAKGSLVPRQKIRFAWWGAEEPGLVGSRYYASHLSQAEADSVDVMLDYDMLASPNYVRFIYDGDGSEAGDPASPPGSGLVEQVHEDYFASQGLLSDRGPFDGRSDYVGFTDRGIPAGGVFAGAEGVKTPEQERIYGGSAGSWYDPCYHQACDSLETISSGVPPLEAEGLLSEDAGATDADKLAAAEAMRGSARRGYAELAHAAAYAVWYFGTVEDPFGSTTAPMAKVARVKRTAAASTRVARGRRTLDR